MGIWDQLNTRTLFGSNKATAEEVNTQEKDIHIEEKNRALLTDVKLINDSLMRDGLPIPGTQTWKTNTVTDNTYTDVFTPAGGEVWVVTNITVSHVDATGTINITLKLNDGTTNTQIFYGGSTSTDFMLKDDGSWFGSFTIDENMTLVWQSSGSYTNSTIQCNMHRVR